MTQTVELAIKTLVLLALEGRSDPQSPRQIADRFDCSVSYLAKVLRTLVGAGILRSVRGAHGGVLLIRGAGEISLLSVVEACQGILVGDFCQDQGGDESLNCSYHQAMNELHRLTVETLSKWTIEDLLSCPARVSASDGVGDPCRMSFEGCEKYVCSRKGTTA